VLTIIYSRFISVINDCIHSHMVVLYILNDNQAIRRPLTPASGWESVANLSIGGSMVLINPVWA